jgi:hypothetical protein
MIGHVAVEPQPTEDGVGGRSSQDGYPSILYGQPKERKMEYFAGLDVSLETVNVCIVNAAGDILLENKIAAEPEAIVHLLKSFGSPFKRIGLYRHSDQAEFFNTIHVKRTMQSC